MNAGQMLNVWSIRSRLRAFDEHLSLEQIAAAVDGRAAADVDEHLQWCERCAADVADLQDLRATTRVEPIRVATPRRWPAFAAAAAAVAAVVIIVIVTASRPTPQRVPATLVALRDSGRMIEVKNDGTVVGVDPSERAAVREALSRGRIAIAPAVNQLRGNASAVMGGAARAPFRVVAPIAIVVETDRPRFRWTALDGSSIYEVVVFDADANPIMRSPPVRDTQWAPAAALARGGTYTWQVTATAGGTRVVAPRPPEPEARFAVADEATVRAIHARRGHLTRALAYARAGIVDDAESELRALIAENPDATIPRTLLANLQRASPTTTNPAQ